MDARLSAWGKSVRDETGTLVEWLPLHQHLDDTMGVADLLVRDWVPAHALKHIASDLGGVLERARALVVWCAAVHDIGKASPAFAIQVAQLADRMRESGLDAPVWMQKHELRPRVNHALVGHVAVQEWLTELGFGFDEAEQWASVVGSHHGVTPEWSRLAEVEEQGTFRGEGAWEKVRTEFLEWAAMRVGGRDRIAELKRFRLGTPSLALVTAIVIMSDWIASNPEFFPLLPASSLREPEQVDDARLGAGWKKLGLRGRWTAPVPGEARETFAQRFHREPGSMRDVQVAAVEAARTLGGPGLLVIEAPMGSGKTEAALLAAEVLAHSSGANGCFVALPTQATTDAMFSRVRGWLERVPGGATVSLAHGKAHLNDEYSGLSRGRFDYVGADNEITVHGWLRGRKKSGLADFVVGTIDQVLFAGLKSRHVMLRHLMLTGKVVVIDEVHAYDVYMSQYLHRVLRWLGTYRVPVVLLSATLPDTRRRELINAYEGTADRSLDSGYPMISGSQGVPTRVLPLPQESTKVAIDRIPDDLDELVDYLRRNLAFGGCAVVVRNTVGRVQEAADRLAAEFGADAVSVNHARFLACDRAAIDTALLRRFGPPETGKERPDLHIVVASQVVEQSLDIDFDVMVTDLAPIDLVLQRLGRLHRHHRPSRTTTARCAITGTDWSATPPTFATGSTKVYQEHQLLRAAALLVDRDKIALPHDIAPLVQAAYGPSVLGPVTWQPEMEKAHDRAEQESLKRAAAAATYLLPEPSQESLVGWLHASAGEVDDGPRGATTGSAQVRDGAESLEVLVVQRDSDGGIRTPDWIERGGEQIPLMGELPWPLVRTISACSLRLPLALSHGGVVDAVIAELEQQFSPREVPSFHTTKALRGQLVLALDDARQADVCGYRLTYDITQGLRHERL
ncbi:CRISPR-associated helicase/endonuclease Cas3 [Actinokineospora globicatena]|uniref:CRISPR-associated helicase/endonuclease Cas3 n=2 Tax=Actinokineospora globicatena TaxID=103729 RepID=A0A9W6QJP5_9PSEU|nr:CRISPR-associated helicase/endonuclease Cas3 [Actinokineospora globicatena]